jgi:nucleotide-binding universal stress UspA family protein
LVLHIVPPEPYINSALEPATWEYEDVAQRGREEMAKYEVETISDIKHDSLVETGSFPSVLTRVVKERDISLVVMGTHGRTGIGKCILGSVAEQIFRTADCPVLTIGPDIEASLLAQGHFRSVVFATDFSAGSKHALPFAVGFAQESGARLTLMHAVEEGSFASMYLHEQLVSNASAQLAEMVRDICLPHPPSVEVVSGYPVEEILRIARKSNSDLIVLGVHKSSGIVARTSAHLPWTIASTVVCHAKCPVLTVRG